MLVSKQAERVRLEPSFQEDLEAALLDTEPARFTSFN